MPNFFFFFIFFLFLLLSIFYILEILILKNNNLIFWDFAIMKNFESRYGLSNFKFFCNENILILLIHSHFAKKKLTCGIIFRNAIKKMKSKTRNFSRKAKQYMCGNKYLEQKFVLFLRDWFRYPQNCKVPLHLIPSNGYHR